MKITFLGATKTVTGSNFLVEAAGKRFLVDCGMWQGNAELEMQNAEEFEFDPNQIDFMLLTHAHIDHSGRIPKLYNEGFRNKIYAHKATCDLCTLMLPDSGHIQEMENEWKNKKRKRKGEKEVPPLYTAEEAARCLEIFEPIQYDEIIEITPEIHVRFNDAGHMLGSSIIELWVKEDGKETKTVFTGDLGNNDIPLLDSPTMIEDTDYLVMESTYGSRLHLRNDEKAEIMKGDNPLEFPGLKFTRTADESKALNEDLHPSIIISASGMCEVGRIKHHLKHNLWNPKSTILFVGYQAPGTLGYNIVNGAKKVKIFGEEIAVNARVEYIEGYSGHADQEGLMNFIYSFISKPKHIFLVHGEAESQEIFKEKVESETGIPVTIPEFGETYDVKEQIEMTHKIERKVSKTIKSEIIERLEKLKSEMNDMDQYVRQDVNNENLRDEDIFRINEKIKDLEKQILNVIEG